jgi:outer membrane protein TolC
VLQAAVGQAAHALAVLVGEPPAALDALVARPQAVPQAREGMTVLIPADTLRQRADVRAAEYQYAAALARVQQARAARWPGFSIAGSFGTSATSAGALVERASVLTSVLASISVPVFDGGALRATVRAQRAALEQARQSWRAAVLGALQQVEDALVALRADQQQLLDLGDAAGAATRAALLARQRYGSGLVDFQVVLETQRTQFSAQDGLASATATYSSDHVRLYRALGGGWGTP